MQRRFKVAILALGLFAAAQVHASEAELTELAGRLITLRGEVETLHETLAAEKQAHRARMGSTVQRRAELEAQLQRQSLEIDKLRAALAQRRKEQREVEATTTQVTPVATNALERLRGYVTSGLPFKQAERLGALDDIRQSLERRELSAPKAISRAWAFVEDELRLTRESGLYRQTLTLQGREQLADVLRLGMVLLYLRAGDGSFGYARQDGDGHWSFERCAPGESPRIEALFDAFEKQVRTGFFTLPNPAAVR